MIKGKVGYDLKNPAVEVESAICLELQQLQTFLETFILTVRAFEAFSQVTFGVSEHKLLH